MNCSHQVLIIFSTIISAQKKERMKQLFSFFQQLKKTKDRDLRVEVESIPGPTKRRFSSVTLPPYAMTPCILTQY